MAGLHRTFASTFQECKILIHFVQMQTLGVNVSLDTGNIRVTFLSLRLLYCYGQIRIDLCT